MGAGSSSVRVEQLTRRIEKAVVSRFDQYVVCVVERLWSTLKLMRMQSVCALRHNYKRIRVIRKVRVRKVVCVGR